MKIIRSNNIVTLNNKGKELTIEKQPTDIISFNFFNTEIKNNLDKSIEFDINDNHDNGGIAYNNMKILFDDLKDEYYNYKDYFDKIYGEFTDEFGDKKDIPIYNEKHSSFIFYSENGNYKNNSYIRIFKEKNKYYIYFNKPSMDFIIKEDKSKFKYNSFYKHFATFFNNMNEEKRNKSYGKFKNFNNFV